jgi:hypothetical protein
MDVLPPVIEIQTVAPCIDAKGYADVLLTRHGEMPFVRGVTTNGALFVVWANPLTRTWTMAFITAEGKACPIASGQSLEPMPMPHAVKESEL